MNSFITKHLYSSTTKLYVQLYNKALCTVIQQSFMYSYTTKLYVQLYNLVVCTSELVLSSTLTSLVAFPPGTRKSVTGNMYTCTNIVYTCTEQTIVQIFPEHVYCTDFSKKVQDINCTLIIQIF